MKPSGVSALLASSVLRARAETYVRGGPNDGQLLGFCYGLLKWIKEYNGWNDLIRCLKQTIFILKLWIWTCFCYPSHKKWQGDFIQRDPKISRCPISHGNFLAWEKLCFRVVWRLASDEFMWEINAWSTDGLHYEGKVTQLLLRVALAVRSATSSLLLIGFCSQ